MADGRVFTRQASERLGIHTALVSTLAREGMLPATRLHPRLWEIDLAAPRRPQDWRSVAEAASALGVPDAEVQAMLRDGRLEPLSLKVTYPSSVVSLRVVTRASLDAYQARQAEGRGGDDPTPG